MLEQAAVRTKLGHAFARTKLRLAAAAARPKLGQANRTMFVGSHGSYTVKTLKCPKSFYFSGPIYIDACHYQTSDEQ